MATAENVITVALGEVGYSRWEDPRQGTRYGRWYAGLVGDSYYAESGVPYCAMFVSWVFSRAGAKCAGLPGAYCPSMLEAAREAGAEVPTRSARAGDVIYFDWGSDDEPDHVGIVVENHGTYLVTIEGNTSDTSGGSQTNGGVVAKKTRPFGSVCGIVRPAYDISDLDDTADGILDVDGYLGPITVSKWHRQCGLTYCNCVSGQLKDCQCWFPRLTAVTFEGTGSELMRKVQEMAGVPRPSGIIARGSVCKIQGMLVLWGYDIADSEAGVIGEDTAKAIQRSINDERWKS